MTVLLHDGTADGFLSAVCRAVDSAEDTVAICAASEWQPTLFDASQHVRSDSRRVRELLSELRSRGSRDVVTRVLHVAMSEQAGIGRDLVAYLRLVRRLGAEADGYLANPTVGRVNEVARAVGLELHRLKGLVRFRRIHSGELWGPISPAHNVLAPLALYFRGRMPSDAWILHDVRRRLAMLWDTRELAWVDPDELPPEEPALAAEEEAYQEMWKTYFRNIAVRERRNPRLQRQFMPARYWQHLVETPGRP
jgi:probable DNA metabolism protein